MKTLALSLAAAAAAAIVTGCIAYPVDSYHHGGERGAYHDNGRRYDRDERHDEWRERDRDRGSGYNDRGERRDWTARP